MGSPASISINYDFTPSEASVPLQWRKRGYTGSFDSQAKWLLKATPSEIYLWASDDKSSTGLQVVDGVIIQIDAGYNSLDDFLLQSIPHLLHANILIMLNGDNNCVHAHWEHGTTVLAVLDSNLQEQGK